jgi:hypothetical protein
MIDGKTIHSSGQMEHFKVIVNEKSLASLEKCHTLNSSRDFGFL